jgi:hypothetical protein
MSCCSPQPLWIFFFLFLQIYEFFSRIWIYTSLQFFFNINVAKLLSLLLVEYEFINCYNFILLLILFENYYLYSSDIRVELSQNNITIFEWLL